MLTNFFGNSKPINNIIVTGIFLLVYFISILNEKIIFQWFSIPLFLFFIATSVFINIKNKLTFDNNFFSLFLVLIIGAFPYCIKINSVFFANIFLLLFFRKVYSLKSSKNNIQKNFDASFWLGICFIIEPLCIMYVPMLYIALINYQKINWRTLIIPIIGFITPIIIISTYYFWTEQNNKINLLAEQIYHIKSSFEFEKNSYLSLIIILIISLFFIVAKSSTFLTVINTFRPVWTVIVSNFIIALTILIVSDKNNGNELLYIAFPTALILANGIEMYQNKILGDIILSLFFVAIVASFCM